MGGFFTDINFMKLHAVTSGLSYILMSLLLLATALPARAADYFDPALLSLGGQEGVVTDLSAFSEAGQAPPGTYLVTVVVNSQEHGQHQVVFSPDDNGGLTPALTPAFLTELGINAATLPAFARLPKDEPVKSLTALIPDARTNFDFQQQRLKLSIPQIAMKPGSNSMADPALWEQGITAFLLNYSFNGGRNKQEGPSGLPSSEQSNMFLSLNSGLNWQAWRLRSDATFTWSENRIDGRENQRYQKTNFSNTYLHRDIQSWRSDFLMGENSTGNDVFDGVPFRGVKLSSSEDMLPISLRGFAPVISGIAQSNARVTVTQNGNVVYQTYVAPGPFRLNDIYQTGQGGDLTITVTESDGSVRSWRQAFSSLPVMQRPGGIKYELTAGRYNGGITHGSREAPFMLGTLIYGLPRDITLYGGGVIAQDYASLALGSGISLGALGALATDIIISKAKIYDEKKSGESVRVRYAKSLLSTGTSVDLTAYRYSTRHFYSFSDFNNTGFQLSEGQVPWALARERSDFQMRVSQQLGEWGSFYLSGTRSDYWGDQPANNTMSVGYDVTLAGISYNLAFSVDRIKSDGDWPQNRQLAFNMQFPLSLFSVKPAVSRSYARYQMTHSSSGQVTQQAGLSGSAFDDRLSYGVMQGWDNGSQSGSGSSSTLNMGWQGSRGMANIGYSYSSRNSSLNFGGNGGLLVHSDGLTLSPQLGTSVALVSAPGAGGVSVINGGVRTNSEGYAVVPYLSAYLKNTVSLNPSTLPDDVDLPQNTLSVYPTRGAVVAARFSPRKGYQALLMIKRAGSELPFGAVVSLSRQDQESSGGIVGDGGQVYLSGLPEKGRLNVSWGGSREQQCQAVFDLSKAHIPKHNPLRMLNLQCV